MSVISWTICQLLDCCFSDLCHLGDFHALKGGPLVAHAISFGAAQHDTADSTIQKTVQNLAGMCHMIGFKPS